MPMAGALSVNTNRQPTSPSPQFLLSTTAGSARQLLLHLTKKVSVDYFLEVNDEDNILGEMLVLEQARFSGASELQS